MYLWWKWLAFVRLGPNWTTCVSLRLIYFEGPQLWHLIGLEGGTDKRLICNCA